MQAFVTTKKAPPQIRLDDIVHYFVSAATYIANSDQVSNISSTRVNDFFSSADVKSAIHNLKFTVLRDSNGDALSSRDAIAVVNHGTKEVIVGFRGSEVKLGWTAVRDWFGNNIGHQTGLDSRGETSLKFSRCCLAEAVSLGYRFTVCGHSLGGLQSLCIDHQQ